MGCEIVEEPRRDTALMKDLPVGTVCVIDDDEIQIYRGEICVKCFNGGLQVIGGISYWHGQERIRVRILSPGTLLRIT
jgi:hypothetical protein